ncbi:hypothetical protein ILUMI_26408, partial [Ignelater luminosus]
MDPVKTKRVIRRVVSKPCKIKKRGNLNNLKLRWKQVTSTNNFIATQNATAATVEESISVVGRGKVPNTSTYIADNNPCDDRITEDSNVNSRADGIHFFETLKLISCHGREFGCSLNNLNLKMEERHGLKSNLHLCCNMCNANFLIPTTRSCPESMDINTAAVSGIVSIGGGFSNLQELLSTMNIPCMASTTYQKYHDCVLSGWEATAIAKMKDAAKEEAEYAKSVNLVDSDGIPLVSVVADGC